MVRPDPSLVKALWIAEMSEVSVYVPGGIVTDLGWFVPIRNERVLFRDDMGSWDRGMFASRMSTPINPVSRPISIEYSFESGYVERSRVLESTTRIFSYTDMCVIWYRWKKKQE
jgi:hypothetical protein